MNFLLGADPELFVTKEGRFLSAFGLIEGDKARPKKVDKGAVQVDGMALEFNIDPATNKREFVNNIQAVMSTLREMVPEYNLTVVPTAHFGAEYIEAQPNKAKELGCDPDFNAYTGLENIKPDEALPFRTGAGHVHVGWTEDERGDVHNDMCRLLVKELDVILGLPSLILDTDVTRRKMYGQAGAYRVKPYGVEYRVLSNFWIKSEHLIEFVYQGVSRAILNLSEGNPLHEKYDVETIINSNDIEKAMKIIEEHNLLGGMG
ncbi:MAG: putative COOH.NH2 ligase-type 2 [Prokaryotic dsDNA virus sp.]|nr:MAG: putative COOH.NH2 ligase-type 2 [Prokaryotic dsDNA virus sp.]|tara:strand:- start:28667 stop:29449 length:783 start_codon:yes stop_codon:yes gene_type:complete